MTKNRLIYIPLGGSGEVGMNAYVYGYGPVGAERLILVDLGVSFPDMDSTPGVDLILPDISWLAARRDRIEAIFITHAHEDHVGALALCYERLGVPVYARPFTAHIARRKMAEKQLSESVVNIAPAWPEYMQAGPFQIAFAPISHSIPESAGLVIDTPAGRLVHTGDFKLDPNPVIGAPWDPNLWSQIAQDGVRALICDSTNVFSPQPGRSEGTLAPQIETLLREANHMVVATTFASNVARVYTLAKAAQSAGRSICLLGRAMHRMIEAAKATGVLHDSPPPVPPEHPPQLPRENLMLIVTGSQGERRAASAQLARGKYMGLELRAGDLFLFSSKTIPGNERSVIEIINALSEKGVDVVDDSAGIYHVSGHANRPDLREMHRIMDPEIIVPMHGEHRHLRAHTKLSSEDGRRSILAVNGTMIDLSDTVPQVAEYIETGRVYLDGRVQVGALDGVVRERIRMAIGGHVTVTLIIDEEDNALIGDPWCDLIGLAPAGHSGAPVAGVLEQDLSHALPRMDQKIWRDDDKLTAEVRRRVRKSVQDQIGKKPEVTVVISRLSS